MPRYKITIEYDGSAFVGWQRQANGSSVQGEIERAAEALSGVETAVRGAGRTDAGVHATGQVAHLDLPRAYRIDSVRDALNAHLRPLPIAILKAEEVDDGFDARMSATKRHYLYRIINRRAPLALQVDRAWLVKRKLDAGAMHEAAQLLIGKHDFSTFRDSECQANSPVRTVDLIHVRQDGDRIELRFRARSFLHRQVRSIVGSLEHVGAGAWTADMLRDALEARDRSRCGMVAPAAGLYLTRVDY